jgi:glycosyltransferase involved in cell wall biosynthesis
MQSILDQDYGGPIEVIAVFDREEPVLPAVTVPSSRGVRLLANERSAGPAGGYNTGALAASGEYLAFCNDDDQWLPDKLRLQMDALCRHPEAVAATCGIYLGDGPASRRSPVRMPSRDVLNLRKLLRTGRTEVHMSTLLVRRTEVLRRVGLIDEAIPGSYGEDYDWLIRIARVSPVIVVRRPLVRVTWQRSYFVDRWPIIVEALAYQLEHRPELTRDPMNLARIYGRIAFAHAAMGHRREARRWARRSLLLTRREPRAYLAYLVSLGVVRARTLLRLAHSVGRGV